MYRNFIFFIPLFFFFLGLQVQKDINHTLQIIIQNCHWSMKDPLRFYPQPHAQSLPSPLFTDTRFNALDIQLQGCSFILCDFVCVYISNLHKWNWTINLLFLPSLPSLFCVYANFCLKTLSHTKQPRKVPFCLLGSAAMIDRQKN